VKEWVFFPDEIRCSISGVVGAVIVEDRLLFLPLSPRSSLLRIDPANLVSPKPNLLHSCSKMPLTQTSPPPKDLSAPLFHLPHYFTSTVLDSVGSHRLPLYPQSVTDRASVRFFQKECDQERFSTVHAVHGDRVASRRSSQGRCVPIVIRVETKQ